MTQSLAERFDMTPAAAEFVRRLALLGDIDAASKASGVSMRYGQELVRHAPIQAALAAEVRRHLAVGGAMGVRVLLELAEKGKTERVRADCAKALVDRAGFVAPRAAPANSGAEKTLNEMSIDELKDLAGKLEDELAGRAKEVSAPPNPNDATQPADLLD